MTTRSFLILAAIDYAVRTAPAPSATGSADEEALFEPGLHFGVKFR